MSFFFINYFYAPPILFSSLELIFSVSILRSELRSFFIFHVTHLLKKITINFILVFKWIFNHVLLDLHVHSCLLIKFIMFIQTICHLNQNLLCIMWTKHLLNIKWSFCQLVKCCSFDVKTTINQSNYTEKWFF